jgi:hypothetical protein
MERDMLGKPAKNNLIQKLLTSPGLTALGIRGEMVGRHAVRMVRDGRLLGIWRETIGALEWFPVGAVRAQFRTLTSEDAVRHLSAACRA